MPRKTAVTDKAKFVAEYVATGSQRKAGQAIGRSDSHASELMKDPYVKAEIEKARKEISDQGIFNLKAAMAEADDAIAFAKETRNATAYAKLTEHKAKLNGLLIERQEIRTDSFQLVINKRIPAEKREEIDVTPKPVELEAPTELTSSPSEEDVFS